MGVFWVGFGRCVLQLYYGRSVVIAGSLWTNETGQQDDQGATICSEENIQEIVAEIDAKPFGLYPIWSSNALEPQSLPSPRSGTFRSCPTLSFPQRGVGMVPKNTIPEVFRQVGYTAHPTAILTTQPPNKLHFEAYPHFRVDCTISVMTLMVTVKYVSRRDGLFHRKNLHDAWIYSVSMNLAYEWGMGKDDTRMCFFSFW